MYAIEEIFLQEIDSTQNFAKKNFEKFSKDKITIISAESQLHGIGRRKRSWFSPKNNLYLTLFFYLQKPVLHLESLSLIFAYSTATILQKHHLTPKIRWPNDLLLSNKKVGGILTETVISQEKIACFVGIGLNVNMKNEELAKIDQPATSLAVETNYLWEIRTLLSELEKQWIADLALFKRKGFFPFHHAFENFLAYKGAKVQLITDGKNFLGKIHSITSDGRLSLLLPSKELKSFFTGELSLLKH